MFAEAMRINSGNLIVTDPCYEVGSYNVEVPAVNGRWKVFDVTENHGSWGWRVEQLTALHEDWFGAKVEDTYEDEYLIGVDSGQAGIFDFDYFKDSKKHGESTFYNECCDITLKDNIGIIKDKLGVVSSSGFGDGEYLVTVTKDRKTGDAVQVNIKFIEHEDEENY